MRASPPPSIAATSRWSSIRVAQIPGPKAVITRETRTCLQCHNSAATGAVPGFIMRSTIADRHGYPVSSEPGVTTDRTSMRERWGGWYVTGQIPVPHLGNATTPALKGEMGNVAAYLANHPLASAHPAADLPALFDEAPYLSPHSDAVALLVLAHQTSVHNLITAAGYQARATPDDRMRVEGAAERLVRALLFSGAAPLPGRVAGTSSFASTFASAGPRDRQGRSLRDLDLEQRVFRYPLSYLIYSEGFDALPRAVKDYVARRLDDVLSGRDTRPDFEQLSPADRAAIREILADTKPDLHLAS